MLTVSPASIAADTGDANNLDWTFARRREAFDYLDDGETLTLTYTVRATDDSGGIRRPDRHHHHHRHQRRAGHHGRRRRQRGRDAG